MIVMVMVIRCDCSSVWVSRISRAWRIPMSPICGSDTAFAAVTTSRACGGGHNPKGVAHFGTVAGADTAAECGGRPDSPRDGTTPVAKLS